MSKRTDAPKRRTERDKRGLKNSKIKLPATFHKHQFGRAQSLTPYILHAHTCTHANIHTANEYTHKYNYKTKHKLCKTLEKLYPFNVTLTTFSGTADLQYIYITRRMHRQYKSFYYFFWILLFVFSFGKQTGTAGMCLCVDSN